MKLDFEVRVRGSNEGWMSGVVEVNGEEVFRKPIYGGASDATIIAVTTGAFIAALRTALCRTSPGEARL
jgi:hypothetical protein